MQMWVYRNGTDRHLNLQQTTTYQLHQSCVVVINVQCTITLFIHVFLCTEGSCNYCTVFQSWNVAIRAVYVALS